MASQPDFQTNPVEWLGWKVFLAAVLLLGVTLGKRLYSSQLYLERSASGGYLLVQYLAITGELVMLATRRPSDRLFWLYWRSYALLAWQSLLLAWLHGWRSISGLAPSDLAEIRTLVRDGGLCLRASIAWAASIAIHLIFSCTCGWIRPSQGRGGDVARFLVLALAILQSVVIWLSVILHVVLRYAFRHSDLSWIAPDSPARCFPTTSDYMLLAVAALAAWFTLPRCRRLFCRKWRSRRQVVVLFPPGGSNQALPKSNERG